MVYSPYIEPMVELADYYSTARRTAWLNKSEEDRKVPSDDFPVDPTTILGPSVQTSRVRKWQVLPGRTHPLMTGRGGAEGYIFTATRVLPAEGKVEARGRPPRTKKQKTQATEVADKEDSGIDPIDPPNKKQKVEKVDELMLRDLEMEDVAIKIKGRYAIVSHESHSVGPILIPQTAIPHS